MAITQGTKRKLPEDDLGYLSDESTFYGDEATKQAYESQAKVFSPKVWWESRKPTLMEIAQENIKNAEKTNIAVMYNRFEGDSFSRQLGETVEEFLHRLPPATTKETLTDQWIRIANPHCPTPSKEIIKPEFSQDEGAFDEKSDWARLVREGTRMLEELVGLGHAIEMSMPKAKKADIKKAVVEEKDKVVKKLQDLSIECYCTSGKWLLFCSPDDVNQVWARVAKGTFNNELGISAKVAVDSGDDRKYRLICVYTKDFSDLNDVTRVLKRLKDIGLVEARGKGIYYKCDAYTYLGINGGNKWDIKASMYSSTEILKPKTR